MIIIVTGTNTDVGKTIATAALACQYRDAGYGVEVVKPVQTGDDSDIRDIEKLSGVAGREYAHYPEPLAPNIAARRAGMPQLELHATAERIRHLDAEDTVVLVEGAGGLLVRMADTWTLADLAVELAAPLIVVTSTGLDPSILPSSPSWRHVLAELPSSDSSVDPCQPTQTLPPGSTSQNFPSLPACRFLAASQKTVGIARPNTLS